MTITAKAWIKERARALGFDAVGIADPDSVAAAGKRLGAWLAAGHHGTMGWMADKAARRADPLALWPEARAIIVCAMNYGPDENPLAGLARRDKGLVSAYARNRDYHDVMKKRLKALARDIVAAHGAAVKVFVDTAPVMEKPLAEAAGLGWQGKHTNLVSRDFGAWLFLGSVFTNLALTADAPHGDACGRCRACLDICPTKAFPAPRQLDARRCISYLSIEHKGPIPAEFRHAMGNRVYGCDDCLAICPWNKFAQQAREAALQARDALRAPRLEDLLGLDDQGFRALFSGSPIKRIGRDRFIRNVLVAAGNSADQRLIAQVERLLDDASPLVRAMAVWALGELAGKDRIQRHYKARFTGETDAAVRQEWLRLSEGPDS
ncbi:MAG: tRNA epoxyqueuosine(34) reductase QueG [Pseudomonadota bacterium]